MMAKFTCKFLITDLITYYINLVNVTGVVRSDIFFYYYTVFIILCI